MADCFCICYCLDDMKTCNKTYTVTFADIDRYYNITINAILCYFQDNIARYLASGHIGPHDATERGMNWMINEFHAYMSGTMPLWSEPVEVEVWVSELTGVRVYADYKMRDARGREFAHGESTWLLVDTGTRRPVKCHDIAELVALYDAGDAVRHVRHAIRQGGEYLRSLRHVITATDLDFNGHANNQNYVRLAVAMIPAEFYAGHKLVEAHVKFQQETFLGEEIECALYDLDGGTYASRITKTSDSSPACEILSVWEAGASSVS